MGDSNGRETRIFREPVRERKDEQGRGGGVRLNVTVNRGNGVIRMLAQVLRGNIYQDSEIRGKGSGSPL